MEQIIFTRRQLKFQVIQEFRGKIGMNTTANKFYYVTNLIGFDMLNLDFVHFKSLQKSSF